MCRRHVDEQHAEERLQTAFSEVEDVRKEKEEVERRLRRFVLIAYRLLTWNIWIQSWRWCTSVVSKV